MTRDSVIARTATIGLASWLLMAGCEGRATQELEARANEALARAEALEVMLVEIREETLEMQAQNQANVAEILDQTKKVRASLGTIMDSGLRIAPSAPSVPRMGAQTDVTIGDAPSLGPKTADIEVVEFGDFQCPFCMRAEALLPELVQEYQGKVRAAYRHYPIGHRHPMAVAAARASWAASQQGKFWEMHDLIFASRGELTEDVLVSHAQALGLDLEKFEVDRKAMASQRAVYKDRRLGKRSGVKGTPSFFVDGIQVGGTAEAVRRAIDKKLAAPADSGDS